MALPLSSAAGLLAVCVTLALLAGARETDHCYHEDTDPYLLFASKTAYQFAGAQRAEDVLPYCKPLQVWWMNRHGTRFPGKGTIKKMENLESVRDAILWNHNEGTGRLCDADLSGLTRWRVRINESLDNVLTPSGEEELFLMARRLRQRYPEALQQPYTAARYKFRHTDTQRAEMSARKFAQGLFNSSAAVHIPPAEEDDMLLRPYMSCEEWLKSDASDPPEWRKLVDGARMAALVANVSSRLGFRAPLKYVDVDTMYGVCRFEKAWDVREVSPWCAAFSKEELKLLEYAEDMRYYYKSGYGKDMNVNLGCPLAKDLVERFRDVASGASNAPAGVFYFAHSSTLHMLQARLGVFRDAVAPTADNYEAQRRRRWRISLMGSFAANLGAVFYKCSPPGEPESQQVLFLSREEALDVDGCNVGLCSWEHVRNLLEPLAEQCDLKWCKGSGAAELRASTWASLLVLSSALLAYAQLRSCV